MKLLYVTKAWLGQHYPDALIQDPEKVLWMTCPRCSSMPGQECKRKGTSMEGYHPLRWLVSYDSEVVSKLIATE